MTIEQSPLRIPVAEERIDISEVPSNVLICPVRHKPGDINENPLPISIGSITDKT
jgi:hypothetical protein